MAAALTALVEPVDAGDVVGAHVAGPQDLVGVALGDEGRLAVLGEGVPGRVRSTPLALPCVLTGDGGVRPTCCNA